ncbi:class I histocompatibility antigen, F10 alpha chain-like [Scyliorhinus canicula]|uniref:class I histocompatibility antigen, F10 alpha chain-like n=1 Tax=Scyliorhinus canicula TaxID=7830 RepID=UPI0018F7489D|nr:class I histocompatibility antigen, F10 alpha chain-like [Scyliorhinus canicula]
MTSRTGDHHNQQEETEEPKAVKCDEAFMYGITAQNRYALDYLLAREGGVCAIVQGVHTFQWIMIVEITEDGSIKRLMRVGLDGKNYITFEPNSIKWVAINHFAVKTKEKWNSDQHLNRCLQAGTEYFGQKVQPEVFISRSEANSQYKPLTLSCLVTGFYPVDIEVTWLRNGEVMSETQSSGLRPNHDGSHQIQKEIEINAGDEDQYSCQIEHSSLAEPKLHQWEFPGNSGGYSYMGIMIGCYIRNNHLEKKTKVRIRER